MTWSTCSQQQIDHACSSKQVKLKQQQCAPAVLKKQHMCIMLSGTSRVRAAHTHSVHKRGKVALYVKVRLQEERYQKDGLIQCSRASTLPTAPQPPWA
jgi:hypothetical protein